MGNVSGKFSLVSDILMDELKNIVELMFGDWSDYYYFSQQINMIFKVLWLCKVSETERFSFNTWEGEII